MLTTLLAAAPVKTLLQILHAHLLLQVRLYIFYQKTAIKKNNNICKSLLNRIIPF